LPKWSLIHIELGRIAEDQRRLEDAGKAYERAQELAPADIRAAGGAARLGSCAGEAAQIVRLRRILKRQPANLALLRDLADKTEARGALAEAESALLEVLKLSQFRGQAAGRLALFGERTKRPTAIKAAQAAFAKLRKQATRP
jgi:tetratricopeptide (TPR) repeat protein